MSLRVKLCVILVAWLAIHLAVKLIIKYKNKKKPPK